LIPPGAREAERASRTDLLRALETARADAAQLASALQWMRAEHETQKRAAEENLARRRDVEHTLALIRTNLKRITSVLRAKGNSVEALRKELEADRPARALLEEQAAEQAAQIADLHAEIGRSQKKLWSQEVATKNAEAALEVARAQMSAAVAARLKLDGEAGRLEEKLRKLELKLDSTERNRGRAVEALAVLEADLRQVGDRASAAEAAQREAVAKAAKKQAELTRARRSLRLARDGRDRDQAQIEELQLRLSRMKIPAAVRDAEQARSLEVAAEIRRLADSVGRAHEVAIRAIQERLDREAYERLALELSLRAVKQQVEAPRNPSSRAAAATAVVVARTRQTFSSIGGSLQRGKDGALRIVQSALPKTKPAVVASLRRIRQGSARLRDRL